MADTTETSKDWAVKATTQIDGVTALVRKKAVDPIISLSRHLVFGLVALFVAVLLIPFFFIAISRMLTDYAFGGRVWISYLVIGGISTIGGLFLWRLRKRKV